MIWKGYIKGRMHIKKSKKGFMGLLFFPCPCNSCLLLCQRIKQTNRAKLSRPFAWVFPLFPCASLLLLSFWCWLAVPVAIRTTSDVGALLLLLLVFATAVLGAVTTLYCCPCFCCFCCCYYTAVCIYSRASWPYCSFSFSSFFISLGLVLSLSRQASNLTATAPRHYLPCASGPTWASRSQA